MEKNRNAASPRKGLNTDKNPIDLEATEYTFSLNSNINSDLGDSFLLQTEPSNLLTTVFTQGYVVIGREYDVNNNRTYFFLTNPETGSSQIGFISGNIITELPDDTQATCDNCDAYNQLAAPLEQSVQTPTNNFNILVDDNCNQCLGFNKNHPVRKIVIKYGAEGTTLWWTDNVTLRYINVDNLVQYTYTGSVSCGEDNTQPTCLDCDKLRVFKAFEQPSVAAEKIQLGGNLPAGVYEAAIAYSDLKGNEISSFYSVTNPVSIFDKNNTILTQPELEYETNFGIRFRIDNLDIKYPYYKVSIIYTGANSGTSYYDLGVYSTSNKEFTVSSIKNLKRTTLANLVVPKKVYEKANGLAASNGVLYWYGTTEKQEINLQPVVNLLGAFLRWQTVKAGEDLYEDGVNTSLYRGYMRDEVQPFAIQFLSDDGFATADFPLPHRPATADEITTVDNIDTQSVLSYGTDCSTTDRTKKWQFYNTAKEIGYYFTGNDEYTTIENSTIKSCVPASIASLATTNIVIPCDYTYVTFDDYISDYRSQICDVASPLYNESICDILTASYTGTFCDFAEIFDDTCDFADIVQYGDGAQVEVVSVGEQVFDIEYQDVSDITLTQPPTQSACNIYTAGSDENNLTRDTAFETNYMDSGDIVYKRNSANSNTDCVYASTLIADNTTTPVYLNYDGSTTLSNLLTTKESNAGTNFQSYVHKKAIWYKITFGNETSVGFEITKKTDCSYADSIPVGTEVRYTTFNSCAETAYIASDIVDISQSNIIKLDKVDYPSGVAYIAVDAPIVFKTDNSAYVISPPCGCFYVLSRTIPCSKKTADVSNIVFTKQFSYQTTCQYKVATSNSCNPVPYKYGKLGYWESSLTYPDNEELYNSNNLKIDISEMPADYRAEFTEYFINAGELDADLRCKPIRHPRMPDFAVAPFMDSNELTAFSKSSIYPLGVTIDENLINYFLDVAVNNKLISQSDRSKITRYKIKAGDRTLHKSIIAKGLAYDMFNYQEVAGTGDKVWFPNFPYNDNSENKLLYTDLNKNSFIQHPYNKGYNHFFTFHSPDTSFYKPTLPSELKIEAYQYGASRGNFVSVKDHVEHVVLGKDAYTIATTLGAIEAGLELALNLADLAINASNTYWFLAGFSSGGNPVGAGLSTVALITYTAASVAATVTKVGQYRKQWLDTISDLGQPKNFASYYTSVGMYNYAKPNSAIGDQLRALKTTRYLKPGSYRFSEDFSGTPIYINNSQRESSVFISVGEDYPINYPNIYKNKDNSRTIASTAVNCENNSKSSTVETQIASPYFSLKNYVPDQYGEIGNVQWISTGHVGDLTTPTQFPQIFGGDIFITRFALKRKHPIFSANGVGLASRTPFNYSLQRNVGVPRFYADFLIADESGSLGNAIFPDVATEYNFDCTTGRNSTYLKNPSKFYLFYYGIPYFLVESEINIENRYGRLGGENSFYPQREDFIDWTQEVNTSINNDNTFYYNNVYSKKTTQLLNRSLPIDYSSEYYKKISYLSNQVFWSLQDGSDIDRFEPWLAYKPLDVKIFPLASGKLVDIHTLASEQILTRFDNGFRVDNPINILRERLTPQTQELTSGGNVFDQRAIESVRTSLGAGGTQSTQIVSTEFGHFWVDAKRGQVLQVDQNGQGLKDITAGKTRWFKEQLPFKILKTTPDAEIDNAFNGVGITMGWDSKNKRVFLTKKDKVNTLPCLQYDEELGYVINETLCGTPPTISCPDGYTYNEMTGMCEKTTSYQRCDEGYEFNPETGDCEKISIQSLCPTGYNFNPATNECEKVGEGCGEGLDLVFILDVTGSQSGSLNNIKASITSGILPAIQNKFGTNYRLGLVTVTDSREANPELFNILTPMSLGNATAFSTSLSPIVAQGGGLYPEPTDLALEAVLNNTPSVNSSGTVIGTTTVGEFRPSAIKVVMLATDAAPSGYNDSFEYSDWERVQDLASQANADGVRIFTYNTANNLFPSEEPTNPIDKDIILMLRGSGGTVDVKINGFTYPMTYNTSLQQTAIDFVDNHAAQVLTDTGINITAYDKYVYTDSPTLSLQIVPPNSVFGATIYDRTYNNTPYILNYIAEQTQGTYSFAQNGRNISNYIIDNLNNSIDCGEVVEPNDCTGCVVVNGTCQCTETQTAIDCEGCQTEGSLCTCTVQTDPQTQDLLTPIDINDLQDASWTMAYSPVTESWISYYSFKPNYYVSHQDYFQTGLPNSLWSHLITNRSYQVFYGQLYPWTVETVTKPTLDKKILGSVNLYIDSQRFHNEYDSAPLPKIGIDEMVIYNQTNNSGKIKIDIEDKNNLQQKLRYPITTANDQTILATKYDDVFRINYFYNRIKSENNNLPHWIKDVSDVEKILNLQAITYKSPLPERLKGNWFLVRTTKNSDSQVHSVYKFMSDIENIYP